MSLEPKTLKHTARPLRKLRKLINSVAVPHGFIALGTNWPKIINVRLATLALRNIVTNLECERGHVTLVFKVLVAKPVL